MAPKSKKGATAQKAKGAEEEREEPLQAVVFADSFETKFLPFTLERPRCLLSLANLPLIEYTLEFLASVGAEEVILYCGNHTDQVEEYLKHSRWTKDTAPFSLEIIRSSARSVGDAMRDLDQKQLITGDFICVYGDVVANISLEPALTAHRARVEKSKKAIMTMVLREAGDFHRSKSQHLRPAFIIDPETDRCVHYEQIRPKHTKRLEIPEEVFKDHAEIEVREDLIDCGIDICTPEVLAQYTDNFDWQFPRRGFLYGMLKDYETNQLTIHTHITNKGYATRVKNLQTYDAVSKDVVSRWTYPYCPDTNLLPDQSYQLQRGNVYKEDGVVLARSSIVSHKSVLGRATSVGDGSVISNSIIGRRCVIGKRVKIDGAYIWDDARIGDNSVVEKAIIGSEASIGQRCHVQAGALISDGVVIGDDVVVKGDSRISMADNPQDFGYADVKKVKADPSMIGNEGTGYLLTIDDEEDDLIETLLSSSIDTTDDFELSLDSISTLDSDEEGSEDDTEDLTRRSSRSDSFASIDSDSSAGARKRASDFHHEATASIVDGIQKGDDPNNIQLELQALKLSSNAEDKQIRRAVAVAMMKRIAGLVESGSTPEKAVAKVIPPNKLLVQRCVLTGKENYSEQVEFLLYMQNDLLHRQSGKKILFRACHALSLNALVEAEGFEEWWNDERSSASAELETVREGTKPLIEYLTAESDEDVDEDEDEDEDDDEDGI